MSTRNAGVRPVVDPGGQGRKAREVRVRLGGAGRVAVLALLWGSGFLWIKIGLRGFSPVHLTLVRLVLGVLLLGGCVLLGGLVRRVPRRREVWRHLAVAAAFGNVIPFLFIATGEQDVDSSVAGVLNATTPLWTFLFAVAVGQERQPSVGRAVGLVLGFGGTLLIFSPWSNSSEVASWGGLACLLGSASYGLAYVYMDRHLARRDLPPTLLSACQLTVAAGYLVVLTPLVGRQPMEVRLDAMVAVTILGLFGTGFAYVLNYRMIAEDGATVASTVTYLLPVVAVLLGAVLLDEGITLTMVLGTAVILGGVALARRVPRPVLADVAR